MEHRPLAVRETVRFPRYFRILRFWVNSYKFFLCIGLCVAIFVSAARAQSSGIRPLSAGVASLMSAIAGLVGARLYFLGTQGLRGLQSISWRQSWNSRDGGWSVFGGLFGVIPTASLMCWALSMPMGLYWDSLGPAILAGGPLVRLGCVFNGCCAGRETSSPWGVRLHDVRYAMKRRVPVQFLEIAWWLIGGALYLLIWPRPFAAGSYVLAVFCWYGSGRFWLEPLREQPDLVLAGWRVNQLFAALLAVASAAALVVINRL